ncbi:uncharacterized protein B0J16DRAFT_389819 [Fusarium flagelliforme]|uniref:Uncharacterized protein n=1 Tax=Fusarium flagelliforme TaxID=2675880 RepID=A0A395MCF1_9HYPO|nr:uncharacterized protein B0J16DRAFT_389819 [Fusarium flagelliforme]KAH7173938.1 hypothetical protein B0J16DRAFT_389819 [Fusarium flagelliforme]RFN44779.1 hypothetical protein FIE12Z_10973 [Fusarium flagelliforme]
MSNAEITSQGMFDYYLKYQKLIIVHIWEQDRETLSPVFEHLAKTRAHDGDGVMFAKIDLDQVPEHGQEYHIDSVLYFLTFYDGQLLSRLAEQFEALLWEFVEDAIGNVHAEENYNDKNALDVEDLN